MQKTLLLFVGSYLPGTKSAGVTMSISNMCKYLAQSIHFKIITRDRDIGEETPYKNVELEKWTNYNEAEVFYSSEYIHSLKALRTIINNTDFDAYYINGFYNIADNFRPMLLYALHLIPRKPIIVAPRGIFSMGEFEKKRGLRAMYRCIIKTLLFGSRKNVFWHATAELEKEHIKSHFKNANVFVLPNISNVEVSSRDMFPPKESGKIKIMFISRISGKKNILFMLDVLGSVKGDIEMNFYGIIGSHEEEQYWEECQEKIKTLPENVKCNYYGEVSHDEVKELFEKHHLFFFPTMGENYGHVIAESLAYGCPVLLSDTTPWNMLEDYKAGWNIPLDNHQKYIDALQYAIDTTQEQWCEMSRSAQKVARDYIDRKKIVNDYTKVLGALL